MRITPEEMRDHADKAIEIAPKLRALLAGLPYPVQGAILADLLATYVRGFHPESVRDDVLSRHIMGVVAMIERQDARDTLGEKSRGVVRLKSREETPPRAPTRGAKPH